MLFPTNSSYDLIKNTNYSYLQLPILYLKNGCANSSSHGKSHGIDLIHSWAQATLPNLVVGKSDNICHLNDILIQYLLST
jgi:hypothetical protein